MRPVPPKSGDGLLLLALLVCVLGSLILLAAPLTLSSVQRPRQVRLTAPAGKTKVYIDCRPEGVVLYPGSKPISLTALRGDDSPFQTFLKSLNPQKTYVLLAVRPEGIKTFQTARSEVRRRGLPFGYEPLDRDWRLLP
ncbi:MAG: hypothetical protein GC158_01240 [Cyanobacteria bacterium RI_101]|nr:hypothetical protein [Cyanobacteria bacterium RI_101]